MKRHGYDSPSTLAPGVRREWHLDVVLSEAERDRLDALAVALGLTRSACVRRAIDEMRDRGGGRP